jgi:flagellin FlaB
MDGLSFWVPKTLIYWEVRRVKITLTRGVLVTDSNAAIGIGSLIIFIAMILVAGIAASVIIQTMNSLQQQALVTGEETLRDVSSGVKVTHVSGYYNGSTISQLAIFLSTTAGSDGIDLTYAYISLSDTAKELILTYDSNTYSSSVSNGLFGTLNSSNLTATTYGIMEIRDIDNSCASNSPTINSDDLIVLLVNTTKCFSGLGTRTEVFGNVIPERGISGTISFTTPSAYIDTIIELQP